MSRLQKKPPAHRRGHPTLQNMNFFYFCRSFLPSWIRIRIQIKDPDPMVRLNTDQIRIRIRIRNTAGRIPIGPSTYIFPLLSWRGRFFSPEISYHGYVVWCHTFVLPELYYCVLFTSYCVLFTSGLLLHLVDL